MARHKLLQDIQDRVDVQIAGMGPSLEGYVVNHLAERELNKRGPLLVQGMDKLSEWEAELKKQEKPDAVLRDREGKVTSESYTAKKLEELKKLTDKIKKIQEAWMKAYSDGDTKDLAQLLQSGNKDQAKGEPEGGGTPA